MNIRPTLLIIYWWLRSVSLPVLARNRPILIAVCTSTAINDTMIERVVSAGVRHEKPVDPTNQQGAFAFFKSDVARNFPR